MTLVIFQICWSAGELARRVFESMRREASCLRIQRDLRMHLARKAYKELCSSAVSIQTGMRGMAARNELRFRRETRAAIVIQVNMTLKNQYLVENLMTLSCHARSYMSIFNATSLSCTKQLPLKMEFIVFVILITVISLYRVIAADS